MSIQWQEISSSRLAKVHQWCLNWKNFRKLSIQIFALTWCDWIMKTGYSWKAVVTQKINISVFGHIFDEKWLTTMIIYEPLMKWAANRKETNSNLPNVALDRWISRMTNGKRLMYSNSFNPFIAFDGLNTCRTIAEWSLQLNPIKSFRDYDNWLR